MVHLPFVLSVGAAAGALLPLTVLDTNDDKPRLGRSALATSDRALSLHLLSFAVDRAEEVNLFRQVDNGLYGGFSFRF